MGFSLSGQQLLIAVRAGSSLLSVRLSCLCSSCPSKHLPCNVSKPLSVRRTPPCLCSSSSRQQRSHRPMLQLRAPMLCGGAGSLWREPAWLCKLQQSTAAASSPGAAKRLIPLCPEHDYNLRRPCQAACLTDAYGRGLQGMV